MISQTAPLRGGLTATALFIVAALPPVFMLSAGPIPRRRPPAAAVRVVSWPRDDPPPEAGDPPPGQEEDLFDFGDEDEAVEAAPQAGADRMHAEVLLADRFPPARTCGQCHPKQYREWSVSQHAYAQMSPVFNAMQGTILKLTNGTNGDFCIRCHTPVGMNLGEPEFMSNIDRAPTSREGITCIVCHRVNRDYGKLSGRLAIEEGPVTATVYGPTGSPDLAEIKKTYPVVEDPDKPGLHIHATVGEFFQISEPGFCGTCHDVNLVNGFRLEEAFSAYKQSPAARRGVTCQDCHMATVPGVASPYEFGPAAVVSGRPTPDRRVTNHYFAGPDFPIIHPALFPHNIKAIREENQKDDPSAPGFMTIRNWLQFDDQAGWGTDAFEDRVPEDYEFPPAWDSIDDRTFAREILDENQALLAWAQDQRLRVLRAGYVMGEIAVEKAGADGIVFTVPVRNGTDGHDVPTGFDAERLVFLQVTVTDREGTVVFRSGDLDPNGDVRDLHSAYVHNHELPLDRQLFNLQSKFITRNVRGGEREQVLSVNYSIDPLPFLRPEARPTIIYGRPAGVRKHRKTLPPGAERRATYRITAAQLTGRGPYTANVKLIASMIPVNLLSEIGLVGFDYGMTPRELADGLVAGMLTLYQKEHVFEMPLER